MVYIRYIIVVIDIYYIYVIIVIHSQALRVLYDPLYRVDRKGLFTMNSIYICNNCIHCNIKLEKSLISNLIYNQLKSQLKEILALKECKKTIYLSKCFIIRYIVNASYYYCYENVEKKQACQKALQEMNKENININIDSLNSYIVSSCDFFFDVTNSFNENYSFLLKNILAN